MVLNQVIRKDRNQKVVVNGLTSQLYDSMITVSIHITIFYIWQYCILQDVFDHLKTPGNKPQDGQKAETPLSEVIERNLNAAVANSNRSHVTNLAAMTASPQLGIEPMSEVRTHIQII